ncbi:hypothetical protein DVH24_014760 [Malus domestica]|uniref:Uncharacterized protein n=1 Tax=Malus domestica TaxID=3750 RepID=A0A498K1D9_MALDO|nr:hypothetical protein DVH24_014760 [Malus domestica]
MINVILRRKARKTQKENGDEEGTVRNALSEHCLSHPNLDFALARYCHLWAYHSFMNLFLGTQTRTSQWITHHRIALA